jgi:hypothetical protein
MAKIYSEVRDSIQFYQIEKLMGKQPLKFNQSHQRVTYQYRFDGKKHEEYVDILFSMTLNRTSKKILATS